MPRILHWDGAEIAFSRIGPASLTLSSENCTLYGAADTPRHGSFLCVADAPALVTSLKEIIVRCAAAFAAHCNKIIKKSAPLSCRRGCYPDHRWIGSDLPPSGKSALIRVNAVFPTPPYARENPRTLRNKRWPHVNPTSRNPHASASPNNTVTTVAIPCAPYRHHFRTQPFVPRDKLIRSFGHAIKLKFADPVSVTATKGCGATATYPRTHA